MLRGDALIRDGLRAPPGGVDEPDVLAHVRTIFARLQAEGFCGGHWMIVAEGEIVGLCGIKHSPSSSGEVEIGYGIAASRRRRGHATRGIALLVERAREIPAIRCIIAETDISNVASQAVLRNNGLERSGTRFDPTDGEVVTWRKPL